MASNSEIALISSKNNLPLKMEENSLVSYLEQIKKFPMLSEDEEKSLVEDFQQSGNLNSAQKLITSHLRLAAKIALTYRRYGLPMADIISEANIGLMQAVKKFSLEKKVRLATYAMWWIKASVNDYILRSWSLVKIGTIAAQKKLFYNLNRIKSRLGLYDNKGLEPSVVKKIAHELVVEEKDVVEMDSRLGGDKSLNVVISEDGEDEKIDLLVDSRQNLESSFAIKEEKQLKNRVLMECLERLNDREKYIVKHRLLTDKAETLEDIGAKFSISRERVRQIEKKAFEHLSKYVKLELSKYTDL